MFGPEDSFLAVLVASIILSAPDWASSENLARAFVLSECSRSMPFCWALMQTVSQNELVFRSNLYIVARLQLPVSHVVFVHLIKVHPDPSYCSSSDPPAPLHDAHISVSAAANPCAPNEPLF
jgi:hypothetical protein